MLEEPKNDKFEKESTHSDTIQADLVQLQQSYEHYRHLENIRLRYIVWLYSFVLALLAFVGTLISVDPNFLEFDRISLLVLASFTITFFAFFAHLQVNTTEAAINAHDALMTRIYRSLYGSKYNELIAQPFSVARISAKKGSVFLRFAPDASDPTRWLSRVFTAAPAFLSASVGCSLLISSKGIFDLGETYTWILYGTAIIAGLVGAISILDALLTRNTQPQFEQAKLPEEKASEP